MHTIDHRWARFAFLWIGAICGLFVIASLLTPIDQTSHLAVAGTSLQLPDLCQFKYFLGSDCPGCGMTRSFVYAAHFRWADAWAVQPVGTMLAFFLAATAVHRTYQVARWRLGKQVRLTTTYEASAAIGLAILAYARWLWVTWLG